jgi:hypothetical protein
VKFRFWGKNQQKEEVQRVMVWRSSLDAKKPGGKTMNNKKPRKLLSKMELRGELGATKMTKVERASVGSSRRKEGKNGVVWGMGVLGGLKMGGVRVQRRIML